MDNGHQLEEVVQPVPPANQHTTRSKEDVEASKLVAGQNGPAGETHGSMASVKVEVEKGEPKPTPGFFGMTCSPESLHIEIKDAKKNSSGVFEFYFKFFSITMGTVWVLICLLASLAVPIAMIIIGVLYIYDCPIEWYIPLYLVVGGSFGIFYITQDLGQKVRKRMLNEDDEDVESSRKRYSRKKIVHRHICGPSLVGCFLLAWFICGSVWVYKAFPNVDTSDPESPQYCNYTLFYFSFWLLNATYILIGIGFFGVCCAACLYWISDKH